VAATPMAVGVLTQAGHQVLVQTKAGVGSSFADEEYAKAEATIVSTAEEVFSRADMLYKVKEPIPSEYPLLGKGRILFTYLHLAAAKELTHTLMDGRVVAIAYETVELPDGSLPLLTPMSEIAGRLATQVAAQYLGRMYKGSGKLLGGVPGVPPATVVIIGGGTVGTNAAKASNIEEATEADETKAKKVKESSYRKVTRKIDIEDIKQRLLPAFDNQDYWEKVAAKCLSCGICTFLCPTCYCFDINDELVENKGKRFRSWDSCAFPIYTKMPMENPREEKWRRVRQRVYHKYEFYPMNFSVIACTGCGRCIRHCPVNWDITQTLNNLPAKV